MKTAIAILAMLLAAGCSSIPTMQYCQRVEYIRDGSKINITAECQAPVGGGSPIPGV